ncbi:MAG: hypothetical protein D3914_02870 [Candidatus Electrothrix sp. LOE2]|nr:hypothetical protein [Candidatus Electrothrix sp. LOE2]
MPRPKSILKRIEVDVALKSHNCQHNRKHRIQRGDKRLKIRKDRSWERYCVDCAMKIIERDIEKLQECASELQFDEK